MHLLFFLKKMATGKTGRALSIVFGLFFSASFQADADWINLTGAETAPNIAEIHVLDDHVKLLLEVYIGNLETFDDLIPDQWTKDTDLKRPTLEKRLAHFADETFQFVTEMGEKLPVRIALVESRQRIDRKSPYAGMINPYTRRRVPDAPEDKRVLFAELIYPFDQKPERLTLIPPLDANGNSKVTVGFIAYHKGVPVIDFRYLSGPENLELNWNDPWYSQFENPNLKRHHKDALMSFLYVEPYEVRHEMLIRLRDLENWVDLGVEDRKFIEREELERVKQQIGEFLLKKNPVLIDGQALKPVLDRVDFVTIGLNGIQLIDNPSRVEISTAIVGIIISYITEGMPQQVVVEWELFNDRIERVPATSIDPAGPLPSFVSPDDPVLTWTNFLKNFSIPTVAENAVSEKLTSKNLPLVSFLCILALIPIFWLIRRRKKSGRPLIVPVVSAILLGLLGAASYPFLRISISLPDAMASDLDPRQQQFLLQSLLKNVYRAFDFRNEEDVYEKLVSSVSGDLLTEVYLQNRKSFAIKKAGGAQAKVKKVKILDFDAERRNEGYAYDFRTRWTATGTVGHWGHLHTRTNLYDAVITVRAIDGSWKITGLDLLEEKRIDPAAQDALSEKLPTGQS